MRHVYCVDVGVSDISTTVACAARAGVLRLHEHESVLIGARRTRRAAAVSAHMARHLCGATALLGARIPLADDAIRVGAKAINRSVCQRGTPRAVAGAVQLFYLALLAAQIDAVLAVLLGSGDSAERCHERNLLAVGVILRSLRFLLPTRLLPGDRGGRVGH